MSRQVFLASLAALPFLAALAAADPAPAKFPPPWQAVNTRVSIERPIEDVAVKDVLEFLSDQFHVRFVVNQPAFRAAGTEVILDRPVTLRKIADVPLSRILQMLSRETGGAVLVRRDCLELTTVESAFREVYGERTPPEELPLLFNGVLNEDPLWKALEALGEGTDANIVLDKQVGDAATAKVSARLLNVPAEVAAAILAESAGLRSVKVGNVILVTLPDKARELQAAEVQKRSSSW